MLPYRGVMPTPVATLQSQVDAIDARIVEMAGASQMSDGSTSASFSAVNDLLDARNRIQGMIDRLSGSNPLFLRGRVIGLPNGPVSMDSTRA